VRRYQYTAIDDATRPAGRTGHARAVYAARPTSPGLRFAARPTWLRRRAAECY
jgi:hypothetical protein